MFPWLVVRSVSEAGAAAGRAGIAAASPATDPSPPSSAAVPRTAALAFRFPLRTRPGMIPGGRSDYNPELGGDRPAARPPRGSPRGPGGLHRLPAAVPAERAMHHAHLL